MLQLIKYRPFFLYLFSHTLSNIGLGIHLFTMSWLVLDLTKSTSSLGWLFAISTLPVIILSPFFGVLIDNWDRRLIVVVIQFLKGILLLTVPILLLTGTFHLSVLYGISFLMAIADRLYYPASKGLMREMLTKDQLLSANSMASVAMQLGMLIGSVIAGFLLHAIGGPYTILANSTLAFASSIIIFFTRKGIVNPKSKIGKGYDSFFGELSDGLQYVRKNKSILKIAVLVALTEFTIQIYNILSVPFIRNDMKMGPEILGLLDSFFAWGAILGGITLTTMVTWFGRKHFMSISLLLMGVFFGLIPFMQGIFSGGTIFLLFGTTLLQARTLYSTLIHEQVETHYQGRVNSMIYTLTSIFGFVIYAIIGYIGEKVTPSLLFHAIGLMIAGGAIILFAVSDKLLPVKKSASSAVELLK
ncbi:MFS transporter [Priestia megaterium]|jgi:MFS transporter, DHA3 family, macrolide efflux protein|uniref:MFS transporter n=1 Tax=Priestia megaterium TaxID=1404 RepID=A0A6H1P6J0_PRIMG|nr:MFS transporter [Priestia megaterium]QIZ09224.1 MFS transporter [Priestia megaterium]